MSADNGERRFTVKHERHGEDGNGSPAQAPNAALTSVSGVTKVSNSSFRGLSPFSTGCRSRVSAFAANATVAFSLSAHIPSEVVAAHGPGSGLSVTHPARELEPPRIRVDRRRTRRAPSKIHGWSRTKHRPVLPMFDDGYISILDRIRWAPWERPHSKPG